MPDEVELTSSEEFVKNYYSYIFVKILIVIALAVTSFLVAGYAITIGAGDVSMMETYSYIFNHLIGTEYEYRSPDWFKDYAIWNFRAPRVFAALIAGFGLAVCGCVMQSITKNPLADPYTTGISSGAVFGVSVAMVFGFSLGTSSGNLGLMFNAFIFGLIPAIFIIIVASSQSRSAATIVLAGIAITYIFSSLSTITMMFADEATIKKAYLWQLGTMERVTVDMLPLMFFGVLACSIAVYVFSRQLNLLYLGVVASMLCFLVWTWVMNKLGAVIATNWVYLNPVSTIFFAWWLLSEPITPWFLLGTALILGGMYLCDRRSRQNVKP